MMTEKLINLFFEIFFGILWLCFINNPYSPISIPLFKNGELVWHSLLKADIVEHYQIYLSILAIIGLLFTGMEFVSNKANLWGLAGDIVSILTLVLLRAIPLQGLNLSPEVITKYYKIFYWIINIIILFTMVSGVLKAFNYTAQKRAT